MGTSILDLIDRHSEAICSESYTNLESDLLNTQYDLSSEVLIGLVQKLTTINPAARIPVTLAIVESYLKKSKDSEQTYRMLVSEVQEAMKNPELSPAEKLALASLD